MLIIIGFLFFFLKLLFFVFVEYLVVSVIIKIENWFCSSWIFKKNNVDVWVYLYFNWDKLIDESMKYD